MPLSASNMIEQALQLPSEERARLAEQLLQSLNLPLDSDVEAAWAAEAEARRRAVLSGESETLSSEEVITRLRARHER